MKLNLAVFFTIVTLTSCVSKNPEVPSPDQEIQANNFSELLVELEELQVGDRQAVVDAFLDTLSNAPILERSNCYFIYSGSATSVKVAGDFNFWNPGGDFENLEGTDLWYQKHKFPLNARLDYKLVVNGQNWMLDPLNANRISGGFGPNSEVAMPNYEQPWEINENPDTPQGTLLTETLASTITGKTYTIRVYTPPNYNVNTSYPSVYFQDGDEYLNLATASTVMDNLLDSEAIESVIGVFVVPNNRNVEYAGDDRFKYRDFFADELVPFIESKYSVETSPDSRAVLGDSYGGNISAIIAFGRPDVFGNCGLHSGAFQPSDFETNDLVKESIRDIKVASIWGSYEGSLTTNMQSIKNHFETNEYDLIWKELPEGHSWGLWRATIDDMLIHFFPAQ